MAGAYTHISVVEKVAERRSAKNSSAVFQKAASIASNNRAFSLIGSLGPDYPYLVWLGFSPAAKKWADRMHYVRSGEMIKEGIRSLQSSDPTNEDNEINIAWLLGYTSHVITDVTIHPVIQENVGVYEDNKFEHRKCEMHQDVYITNEYQYNLNSSELFDVVKEATGTDKNLRISVKQFWESLLLKVHPDLYKESPPAINDWHKKYCMGLDVGENTLLIKGRHIIGESGLGIFYPTRKDVEERFIYDLKQPISGIIDFKDLFLKAVKNTRSAWEVVGRGLWEGSNEYESYFKNWNLDTGEDEKKILTYW